MKHLQLKDKPGKLRPIFDGPFQVLQEIGRNETKLDLLVSLSMHPVFDVSLLKKYYGDMLQEGFGLSSSPRLRGRGARQDVIPPKVKWSWIEVL